MRRIPVLIVGGGPVGMMIALTLERLGVSSTVANIEDRPPMHPKGSTQNARTLEHYRRLGLAQRIRAAALPLDHSLDIGYFTRLTGWELARLAMPSGRQTAGALASPDPIDQVPEPLLRCNQMYAESLVFDHLATRPGVSRRYGWRCTALTAHDDAVEAHLEHATGGETETLIAQYVVGADGGRSFVRRHLGIRYEGDQPRRQAYLGGTMVSSHLRIPTFYQDVPQMPCWHYFVVNPELRANLLALNGRDEFLVNSQLTDAEGKPDQAAIAARFDQIMGRETRVEWIGHWTWTAGQALVAERFVEGRIALCGDSAHLFTPTGGFGMNTGVDDAVNLAWKLAAVVRGWGGPRLLASYESERRPIAYRNTAMARGYTHNVGNVPVAPEIEDDSEAGALARARTGAFLSTFREEFASIGIQLGARYGVSPIVVHDGEPPPDRADTYVASSVPGGRAPHVWLRPGHSLFDSLGPGFTLLRLGADAPELPNLEEAARRRDVPLKTLHVEMPEARELYGRSLAVIRPDLYVAWRGDKVPDPHRLLDVVTGW